MSELRSTTCINVISSARRNAVDKTVRLESVNAALYKELEQIVGKFNLPIDKNLIHELQRNFTDIGGNFHMFVHQLEEYSIVNSHLSSIVVSLKKRNKELIEGHRDKVKQTCIQKKDGLEQDLLAIQKTLESIGCDYEQTERNFQDQSKTRDLLKRKHDLLVDEINHIVLLKSNKKIQLDALTNKIKNARLQAEEYTEEMTVLVEHMEEAKKKEELDWKEIQQKLITLNDQLQEEEGEKIENEKKLAILKSSNKVLEEQVQHVESETSDLQETISQVDKDIEETMKETAQAESELNTLLEKRKSIEDKYQKQESDHEAYTDRKLSELKVVENNYKNVFNKHKKAVQEKESLLEDLKKAEGLDQDNHQKVEELSKLTTLWEKQLINTDTEIENIGVKTTIAKEEIARLSTKRIETASALHKELDEYKRQMKEVEEEIKTAKLQKYQAEWTGDELIKDHHLSVSNTKQELERLMEERDTNLNRCQKLQDAVSVQDKEISVMNYTYAEAMNLKNDDVRNILHHIESEKYQIDELLRQRDQLQHQTNSRKTVFLRTSNQIKGKISRCKTTASKVKGVEDQIEQEKNHIKKLITEKTKLQDKLETSRRQLHEINEKHSTESSSRWDQIISVERKVQMLENCMQDITNSNEHIQSDITRMQQEIFKLRKMQRRMPLLLEVQNNIATESVKKIECGQMTEKKILHDIAQEDSTIINMLCKLQECFAANGVSVCDWLQDLEEKCEKFSAFLLQAETCRPTGKTNN